MENLLDKNQRAFKLNKHKVEKKVNFDKICWDKERWHWTYKNQKFNKSEEENKGKINKEQLGKDL